MATKKESKRSPALKKAQDKYYKSHKKERYLIVMRSHCKTYILKKANAEELQQVKEWVKQADERIKRGNL